MLTLTARNIEECHLDTALNKSTAYLCAKLMKQWMTFQINRMLNCVHMVYDKYPCKSKTTRAQLLEVCL